MLIITMECIKELLVYNHKALNKKHVYHELRDSQHSATPTAFNCEKAQQRVVSPAHSQLHTTD